LYIALSTNAEKGETLSAPFDVNTGIDWRKER